MGFVGWDGGGMDHQTRQCMYQSACQILGLTRGSGILHIESMLAQCNMQYMEVGTKRYPWRNKEIKITDIQRDLA